MHNSCACSRGPISGSSTATLQLHRFRRLAEPLLSSERPQTGLLATAARRLPAVASSQSNCHALSLHLMCVNAAFWPEQSLLESRNCIASGIMPSLQAAACLDFGAAEPTVDLQAIRQVYPLAVASSNLYISLWQIQEPSVAGTMPQRGLHPLLHTVRVVMRNGASFTMQTTMRRTTPYVLQHVSTCVLSGSFPAWALDMGCKGGKLRRDVEYLSRSGGKAALLASAGAASRHCRCFVCPVFHPSLDNYVARCRTLRQIQCTLARRQAFRLRTSACRHVAACSVPPCRCLRAGTRAETSLVQQGAMSLQQHRMHSSPWHPAGCRRPLPAVLLGTLVLAAPVSEHSLICRLSPSPLRRN